MNLGCQIGLTGPSGTEQVLAKVLANYLAFCINEISYAVYIFMVIQS